MSSSLCYTLIVGILDIVMVLLTILYFTTKLPEHIPHKSNIEEDLFKNYDIIKYQKKKIRLLKLRLFLIGTLKLKGNK